MFVLNGKYLPVDSPFEHQGVKYPSNWLRLTSLAEKEAIGISEVPDPPAPPNQLFYWGYDADGKPIPKDHAELVKQWTSQTRSAANSLIQPTDWMIIREQDNGTPIDATVKTWRSNLRLACEIKINKIEATTTTDELAAYICSSDYPIWPELEPPSSADVSAESTAQPTVDASEEKI